MDIYSYFNSKTVGEYCRSIGHQFNAMESAFIINDCKSISMDKKTGRVAADSKYHAQSAGLR